MCSIGKIKRDISIYRPSKYVTVTKNKCVFFLTRLELLLFRKVRVTIIVLRLDRDCKREVAQFLWNSFVLCAAMICVFMFDLLCFSIKSNLMKWISSYDFMHEHFNAALNRQRLHILRPNSYERAIRY